MKIKGNKIYLLTIVLVVLPLFIGGAYYMTNQQYQMAILIPELDANATEWPSKRQWFDASKWLKNNRYIKVNDFYLIDTEYTPIDNLNSFNITLAIQTAINDKGNWLSELNSLVDLDPQLFFKLVKDQLDYEYVYTEFNEKTLTPTLDWFLIRFPYQEKKYEALMRREFVNGDFFFMCFGRTYIYPEGEWHRDFNDLLTYKEYMTND